MSSEQLGKKFKIETGTINVRLIHSEPCPQRTHVPKRILIYSGGDHLSTIIGHRIRRTPEALRSIQADTITIFRNKLF